MTGSYPRVKFPPSIKKKRKSASKDKMDSNYENELKCDRAGLETIEPKSIKRIAYKILKKKLSANGEYEHKCDPTQIETIDPNCRFRSQSAHRPRLVLIGDFPVTHSFLQSSHLVVQAFCIFLVLHCVLLTGIGSSILRLTRFCHRILDYSFLFAQLPKALIPTCEHGKTSFWMLLFVQRIMSHCFPRFCI